ncbi:MAG: DNA helicase RecQ [Pseudomonadota bacterium]|nr:DNA helicase RecQ [Pseudomonadota bacterium]
MDAGVPAVKIARAREALHRVFGFADFRLGQEEILAAVLNGQDVMAIMPTGSGKSLLFQLPALLGDGLTVVVSPLIALMRDQVAQMRAYGVAAAALNSAADGAERASIYDALSARRLRLLYVAPERLLRDDTLQLLHTCRVDLLAIDEAHCVSQWGHDFRPEYIRLKEAAQALGRPPTLAVTATADAPTRADIEQRLFFQPPKIFVRSFDRPNLFLAMRPKTDATRQLWEALERHRGESGIVYCGSRKRTEELAREFSERGRRALPYHAGLPADIRSSNQDAFLQEDGVVMCATIAFGMGVDKPDVRFVCHADMPSSIESYYQEIGRAGRDGLPADTLTLYGAGDIELRRRQIEEGEKTPERRRVEQDKLDDLVALCESARCRRQMLLGFFGEESGPCGHCDVCNGAVRLVDGSLEAQKALSAVYRTAGRFFFGHLANILSGKTTDAVERYGHHQLKTFGVGKDRSPADWRGVLRQLLSAKMIDRDRDDRDRLIITDAGRAVLKGETPFPLREDVLAAKPKGARKLAPTPRDADADLFAALKALRAAMAKASNQPAYVIFPDRTLIEMAKEKPRNLVEMAEIHGVGEQKLQKFGSAFLAVVKDHA